ncbi:protein PLASTID TRANSCRIPTIONALLY ACTIVE 10 [Vitis vinifera]|uniref:S1 motif domain-containing protein n=1 Tax=Vitis vinifera TaxID=29760 RepID=F6GSS7_VITVI|nr:protein PLASTID TRANSCRIPTIONALLY ACTIVE 10 [Vitis vinifera]|eukprot:XP_002279352.1 PREDICTED: protein PLASTID TRANSCRIPTIONALLY ACTIVE 10 [Vitis vinifera]
MQILQSPHLFTFPSHRPPRTLPKSYRLPVPFRAGNLSVSGKFVVKSVSSDEFPVDETFLEKFGPKDKETEDEARRKNWIERGWAPWEEILTPEADFARKSLNEGEEVPLKTPEAIEAFKMLNPKYRKKKMEESGLTEDEWYAKQFEIKGEIPEPVRTFWDGPLVVRHVPPRDWPPRGWEVNRKELAFIREAHKLQAVRVDPKGLESARTNTDDLNLERYKTFLKQYNEWVEHNKDRLEEESFQDDQDYHPGRRKRGKDYEEGMYELPFYYPGQICAGKVTTLHLYQGAFVDIGGVYDGWVPIKGNDWYWIRHHIKVGMHVIVEILAKRDPYRFRFPIEMRFVDPNIDHLIFNRFDFPPIFHHDEDTNPDELRRDCGRPPIPKKDPGIKVEEEPLLSNHPYVDKLWQIHVAEQMILDDMEVNPHKYEGKKLTELTDDEDFDEENSVEYTKVYYKKSLLPKKILKTSVKELDLEAALAEREYHNKLRKEAKERGEEYKIYKLRRNIEMDEYDLIHWRRSFEEREALIRDISCRQALGLPLEEPGKLVDASYFGKGQYDPQHPLYRYDYWGEPKNSEKSKQQRMTDAHNKSIVGKGTVWYEMSYEDAIKQRMQREARAKEMRKEAAEEDDDTEEEDDDDDDEFDFSILGDSSVDYSNQPLVNGTESSRMSDEGMFEN